MAGNVSKAKGDKFIIQSDEVIKDIENFTKDIVSEQLAENFGGESEGRIICVAGNVVREAIPVDENLPKIILVGDGVFEYGKIDPIVLAFDIGEYKDRLTEIPIENGTVMYIHNLSSMKCVELRGIPLSYGEYYSEFVSNGDESGVVYTPMPSRYYAPDVVYDYYSIAPGNCLELMWWNGYFFFTDMHMNVMLSGDRLDDFNNIFSRVSDLSQRLVQAEGSIDNILYVEIEISSFSHNAGTKEMGETVSALTLSWKTNKTPAAIKISEALSGTENVPDVNDTTSILTNVAITMDSNPTFTLAVTDERDLTVTKTTKVNFYNGVYYGKAADPEAYNSEFILGLSKNLRASKLTSFTVTPGEGEYIYYCLPTRMGACTFAVGGFTGGFTLVDTISFTNASGYTEDYYIYKSDTANLGSTTVSVS